MARTKRRLLGPDGEPISTRMLKREVAAPSLGGIRGTQWDQVSPGMTPQRLAAILRAAEDGEHRDYLTLAEEMEERELHYIAVLGTRKRALSGLPIQIEAASEGRKDQQVADACREMCEAPILRDLLDHLTDSLGKGYAVAEILWETSASQWRPQAFLERDPRHFLFDRLTRRELRLVDLADPEGVRLQPYKFVHHVPRLKSGVPVRGGLAKPAAWAYIFKSYTLKDWMAFCEVFGMPIRIGKYGPQATEEDRRKLLTAVRNIGTDAAAIIPETMALEFAEVKGGSAAGTNPVFASFAEYLDKQLSKLVLGQTMTTDSGSSMAQAKVHENVRRDILVSDARQLQTTIDRDLIRPFVDLNFGPQKVYPRFTLPVAEPEDLKALADNLAKLVPLGLRVAEGELRDRFGFTDPDEGEIVLGRAGLEAFALEPELDAEPEDDAADPIGDEDEESAEPPPKAANRRRRKAPSKPRKGRRKAAASRAEGARAGRAGFAPSGPGRAKPCPSCGVAHNTTETDADLAALRRDALAGWEEVVDPMLKPIRDLVNGARDYDQFLAGLPRALARMDSDRFVATLAASMAIARGLGDVGVAGA